jgi:hypothetical protein
MAQPGLLRPEEKLSENLSDEVVENILEGNIEMSGLKRI